MGCIQEWPQSRPVLCVVSSVDGVPQPSQRGLCPSNKLPQWVLRSSQLCLWAAYGVEAVGTQLDVLIIRVWWGPNAWPGLLQQKGVLNCSMPAVVWLEVQCAMFVSISVCISFEMMLKAAAKDARSLTSSASAFTQACERQREVIEIGIRVTAHLNRRVGGTRRITLW